MHINICTILYLLKSTSRISPVDFTVNIAYGRFQGISANAHFIKYQLYLFTVNASIVASVSHLRKRAILLLSHMLVGGL